MIGALLTIMVMISTDAESQGRDLGPARLVPTVGTGTVIGMSMLPRPSKDAR